MQQGDVVLRFLVPADEDSAKAVDPTMRPFHHPTPRLEAGLTLQGLGFLAPRSDVAREGELGHQLPGVVIVVALVQTQSLLLARFRQVAMHRDTLQRRFDQFLVMTVGPVYGQAHGDALSFHQHAALDPPFAAVGRVGTGFFSPPAGPWSCTRPDSATPSRGPSVRRRRADPPPRTSGRRRLGPTPGNGRGRWSGGTSRWRPELPTDSRCGGRTEWRPGTGGRACGDDHRRSGGNCGEPATGVGSWPRGPRTSAVG